MTFQPLIPTTGIVGFQLLSRTEESQRQVFDQQPAISRDLAYFEENIANATTAEALVSDRRLLRVVLGAFGLDEEIDKGAFIRKILEEGTENPEAFANRLVDPRYTRFAESLGYGNVSGARVGLTSFASDISAAYRERQFEIAVGNQDESLRLALNFRREIQAYATAPDPDGTAWLQVLGDLPVRRVFEGAFGFGSEIGTLEVDRQREEFREQNSRVFGDSSLAVFTDPEVAEQAIRRFLAREAASNGPDASTPGFAALTLLNGGIGAAGIANILASRTG
ncbi:MAG: DUF1217 domain-containing protein [Pseudomonadota bacterium]